jgi:hypothetical protein
MTLYAGNVIYSKEPPDWATGALPPKPKYQAFREWEMEKSVEEAFHGKPRNCRQNKGERPGFSAGYFQISANKDWHCERKANQKNEHQKAQRPDNYCYRSLPSQGRLNGIGELEIHRMTFAFSFDAPDAQGQFNQGEKKNGKRDNPWEERRSERPAP